MTIDLGLQQGYLWALLPEIVLSLWGMLVLMVDVFQKGDRSGPSSPIIPWLAIAGLVLTAVANAWLATAEATGVGLVAVDGFRVFTNYIFLIAAGLAILVSVGYLDRHEINRGEFHALILFSTVGMMLMAASVDLVLLFLALELMSVGIYVLVGFNRRDPRSAEGSLKYFLLGAFSSAFFLYGVALVFGSTGTTNVTLISPLLETGLASNRMFIAGAGLLLVGLAFKVAAVPFHVWTPDAYDGAPTPVTALMATGVKAAAFAAFIRVFAVGFAGAYQEWAVVLWWVAMITMFGANLVALTQGSVKRMLAYSSIAHAGYLLVALISASEYGAAAFLFYLLVYTLMTIGAFGVVIAASRGARERIALHDYAGFGWEQPVLGALFAVFMLSLAGFPLTGGFIGKLYILRAAVSAGHVALAVGLVLASVISYFYYLRVVVVMYMQPKPAGAAETEPAAPTPATRFAIMAAGVAVLLLFFLPGFLLSAAQQSVETLFVGASVAGMVP